MGSIRLDASSTLHLSTSLITYIVRPCEISNLTWQAGSGSILRLIQRDSLDKMKDWSVALVPKAQS